MVVSSAPKLGNEIGGSYVVTQMTSCNFRYWSTLSFSSLLRMDGSFVQQLCFQASMEGT